MATLTKSNALRTALSLDFSSEQELYEYIGASVVNGQRRQAVQLFKKLHDSEKRACLDHNKGILPDHLYADLTHSIAVMS